MSDILEIRDQPLSTLLSFFMICPSCQIVDRDDERIAVGYPCPNCGNPSSGGRNFFPYSSVHSLIDLMQDFFHLRRTYDDESGPSGTRRQGNHRLAVVIAFCTLGEVLLQHFLENLMTKMELPQNIQERLLDDNLYAQQRIQRLFPSLTGTKWSKTVEKLNKKVELDYIEAVEFYKVAVEKRNYFLHRGNQWAIPQDMPEKCLRQIWSLVNLFVSLHNEFIAQTPSK